MLYVLIAIIVAIIGGLIEKLIKSELESINYCEIVMVFVLSLIVAATLGIRFLPDKAFSMAEKNEKVETYDLALNPENKYYDIQGKKIMFSVHDTLKDINKPFLCEMDNVRFKEGASASITVTKEVMEWTTTNTVWFLFEPLEKESVKEVVCTIPRNDCINDERTETNNDVRNYCTNCQMEIKSTWNFCGNCGQKLTE